MSLFFSCPLCSKMGNTDNEKVIKMRVDGIVRHVHNACVLKHMTKRDDGKVPSVVVEMPTAMDKSA